MTGHERYEARAARKFTAVTKRLAGIIYLYLLQVDPETDQYETIFTSYGKWFFDNTDVEASIQEDTAKKGNYVLYVADDSDEMHEAMITATHIQIGDKKYVINRPDSVPPNPTTGVMWQIYCDHELI